MNRGKLTPSLIGGLLLVMLGSWILYSTLVRQRVPGAQYRQQRGTIDVFDAEGVFWSEADQLWMLAGEPQAGVGAADESDTRIEAGGEAEAPSVAVWDAERRQWVVPRRDPETGVWIPSEEPAVQEGPRPARVWQLQRGASAAQAGEPNVQFCWSQTIGLWIAALLTLCVFSFLYRDNLFYKLAESLVVGVSAAYLMAVGFWTMIVPNLIGKLWPGFVARHVIPEHREPPQAIYYVVLILSLMLLWRLSPRGGWIARWPLAFVIGITAGFRLIAHLEADFAIQIQATILPLIVRENGTFHLGFSLRNAAIVFSVFACLTYFFFSIEHTGLVGRMARLGIWVLMITFGAGFAYTVMGRITLLTQRLEFLLGDWLRLIG